MPLTSCAPNDGREVYPRLGDTLRRDHHWCDTRSVCVCLGSRAAKEEAKKREHAQSAAANRGLLMGANANGAAAGVSHAKPLGYGAYGERNAARKVLGQSWAWLDRAFTLRLRVVHFYEHRSRFTLYGTHKFPGYRSKKRVGAGF